MLIAVVSVDVVDRMMLVVALLADVVLRRLRPLSIVQSVALLLPPVAVVLPLLLDFSLMLLETEIARNRLLLAVVH